MTNTLRAGSLDDLAPLARLLAETDELVRVNSHAKHPFDPMAWREKWLGEPDDAFFYLLDEAGRIVGFVARRVGVGPQVRPLTQVFVEEAARGGAGHQLAAFAKAAARGLRAGSITLKVELDDEPAHALYRNNGYDELDRRRDTATMRLDLDS